MKVKTVMSPWAETIYKQKYAFKDENGKPIEEWEDTAWRVATNVLAALGYSEDSSEVEKIFSLIRDRKFLPGGRYLYASGRGLHQTQNCLLLRAEDSREGWAELTYKATMALMTGDGIGVDYSALRPSGSPIKKTGGTASGPIALMQMINELGRNVMQGGSRRSAIWAGLSWKHDDIMDFIHIKDWSQVVKEVKKSDFSFPAPMELTNISVQLDDEFFKAYSDPNHLLYNRARSVYTETLRQMVKTAEPGFSIDLGLNSNETLRNACTEICSEDDSDICNLGSINLSKIESPEEMEEVVRYATLFLLAGTVYSHVPYQLVSYTRSKNRRLGLGIMGVHEWLLQRGKRYEPDTELAGWLEAYARSGDYANEYADHHGISRPIKTRAIAPTGTIGIIAETTTGIEPIFCVAFKRRYLDGNTWRFQYVVDPTAKRLVDSGIDPHDIEDAHMLSYNVERRITMQAWIQQYVDHGISSTINLPYAIEDQEEADYFGDILFNYLPKLRGITCYPDGARGGQPLTPVSYELAVNHEGVVFEESEERCVGGACGI
jgi:ribonucleoside-diphosphate reductase alpha chain